MADTTTRFIMEAIDKASAVINKVGGSVGKAGAQFKDLANEIPGLNQAMALMTNPLALTGAGIAAAGKFAADATKETLQYNREIRDLAQNLGRSTEETSRIIQTMDDFGVSQASVTTALEMALKNGFAPTVDTLAKMSDEYNKIQDPTERAAKLTEVFGRNWTELVPALKQGGDAIRAAAAAQSKALIVTEESAQATRDYEVAMDGLGDSVTAIKYKIGNALIPVLTNGADALNDMVLAQDLWDKAIKRGLQAQAYQLTQGKDLATNIAILTKLIDDYDQANKDQLNTVIALTVGTQSLTDDEIRRNFVLAQTVTGTKAVTEETVKLIRATDEEIEASNKSAQEMIDRLNSIYDVNLSDVNLGLSGMIKNNLDELKVAMAGGGAWDDALRQVVTMYNSGKISDQIALDLETSIAIGIEQAKVRAGVENVWEGASNLADALRITPAKAYELITGPVLDQIEFINGLSAYVYVGVNGPGAAYVPGQPNVMPNGKVDPASLNREEKASGGPVSAGQEYWVGDGGEPELFVPKSDGTIVPKHNIPGGTGGITVINNFNAPVSSQSEARDGANQGVLAALRAAGRA